MGLRSPRRAFPECLGVSLSRTRRTSEARTRRLALRPSACSSVRTLHWRRQRNCASMAPSHPTIATLEELTTTQRVRVAMRASSGLSRGPCSPLRPAASPVDANEWREQTPRTSVSGSRAGGAKTWPEIGQRAQERRLISSRVARKVKVWCRGRRLTSVNSHVTAEPSARQPMVSLSEAPRAPRA